MNKQTIQLDENTYQTLIKLAQSNVLKSDISILDITARTWNILKNNKIYQIADLIELTPDKIIGFHNSGKTTLYQIEKSLRNLGLSLKTESKNKGQLLYEEFSRLNQDDVGKFNQLFFSRKLQNNVPTDKFTNPNNLKNLLSDIYGGREFNQDILKEILKRNLLQEGIVSLDARTMLVLCLSYGLFGIEHQNLKNIANLFNLSSQRIGDIRNKALRQLRHPSRIRNIKQMLFDSEKEV